MPVTGSTQVDGLPPPTVGVFRHTGHAACPEGMRRLHVGQISRVLHSGQIFQLSLTSLPQPGHDVRPSGVSHTGHTRQVSLTASPQEWHFNSLSMLAARSSDPDFPRTMTDLRVNLSKFLV
jgi:hypothetical protein